MPAKHRHNEVSIIAASGALGTAEVKSAVFGGPTEALVGLYIDYTEGGATSLALKFYMTDAAGTEYFLSSGVFNANVFSTVITGSITADFKAYIDLTVTGLSGAMTGHGLVSTGGIKISYNLGGVPATTVLNVKGVMRSLGADR